MEHILQRLQLSLKQRLLFLISALTALLCVAGGVYIVARAQSDIRGEVISASALIDHYLDAQFLLANQAWRQDNGIQPQLHIGELADVRHVEISFYDNAGKLLETSASAQARRHAAPFWFAWLVQHSFVPIADTRRAVDFNGAHAGEVVVHPDPTFEMNEIWNVTRGLLGLLLFFFVLVNALIWWAVARAMRPIERVRGALHEIGAGHLAARLPAFALPELAGLSGEFNEMADALERSVAQNRELTRQLIQAQEDERTRIAHELHDEIGQCITAIHADAAAIERAGRAADPIRASAAAIIAVATQMKGLLRGMLQRLRPAMLDQRGLDAALRELVAAFRQRNPQTMCALHVDAAVAHADDATAIAAYRIVQEALTNVARHARARNVRIDLIVPRDTQRELIATEVIASIADDGCGFDAQLVRSGFGLAGMRERTRDCGGEFVIDSAQDAGVRVIATLRSSPGSDIHATAIERTRAA